MGEYDGRKNKNIFLFYYHFTISFKKIPAFLVLALLQKKTHFKFTFTYLTLKFK